MINKNSASLMQVYHKIYNFNANWHIF